jgi:hypothetical protein
VTYPSDKKERVLKGTRAQRRIWKEVGLENALPLSKESEGLKAHSKWGRVTKHTIQEMKA